MLEWRRAANYSRRNTTVKRQKGRLYVSLPEQNQQLKTLQHRSPFVSISTVYEQTEVLITSTVMMIAGRSVIYCYSYVRILSGDSRVEYCSNYISIWCKGLFTCHISFRNEPAMVQ